MTESKNIVEELMTDAPTGSVELSWEELLELAALTPEEKRRVALRKMCLTQQRLSQGGPVVYSGGWDVNKFYSDLKEEEGLY